MNCDYERPGVSVSISKETYNHLWFSRGFRLNPSGSAQGIKCLDLIEELYLRRNDSYAL